MRPRDGLSCTQFDAINTVVETVRNAGRAELAEAYKRESAYCLP